MIFFFEDFMNCYKVLISVYKLFSPTNYIVGVTRVML